MYNVYWGAAPLMLDFFFFFEEEGEVIDSDVEKNAI